MLYLFEYYHVQTYGKQYSDLNFIRWDYGPYAQAIESELNDLIFYGLVKRETVCYHDGRKVYLHKPSDTNIAIKFPLDANKRYIADRIILELSYKSYEDMIKIVYSTPPMEKILKEEESTGSKLYGRRLNMKEAEKIYSPTKERLIAARKRRLERKSKGSDKEYLECIIKEYTALEPLRREASKVGIYKL
jgi:hypothetical protein